MMAKINKYLALFFLTLIISAFHPFHVGVTQINIKGNREVQLEVRVFTDDIQKVMLSRGIEFNPENFDKQSKNEIESYLMKHLQLKTAFKKLPHTWVPVPLKLVGFEKESDETWFYLEPAEVLKQEGVKWRCSNTVLFDLYEDQVHVVNTSNGEVRVSEQLHIERRSMDF